MLLMPPEFSFTRARDELLIENNALRWLHFVGWNDWKGLKLAFQSFVELNLQVLHERDLLRP